MPMVSTLCRRTLMYCGLTIILAVILALFDIYRPKSPPNFPIQNGTWEDHWCDSAICLSDEPTKRIEISRFGGSQVFCWPSVGGTIIADGVSDVELNFIGFNATLDGLEKFSNVTKEDELCRQVRKIGGKWWDTWWDYVMATEALARFMSATEKEVLHLGWPSSGGVWAVKLENRTITWDGLNSTLKAQTMDERCQIMADNGATFCEDPMDCEYVKPLLEGFGEHGKEDNTPTWDLELEGDAR